MTILNNQQRNIINPFARTETEYDFDTNRNKFVQDCLHAFFLSNREYPPHNTILNVSREEMESLQIDVESDIPNTDPVIRITSEDLLAYSKTYPQNATPIILNEDYGLVKLKVPSQSSARSQLRSLVTKLETAGKENLYISKTSPTSLEPEFLNSTSREAMAASLIAIPPQHSVDYLGLIYKALEISPESSLDEYSTVEKLATSIVANSYLNTNSEVDIYDWPSNCDPGAETKRIYYNQLDDKFYFTVRTDSSQSQLFDLGFERSDNEVLLRYMNKAVREGTSQILKYTGKYTEDNLQAVLNIGLGEPNEEGVINFLTHMNTRPGSRWCHAVRIPREKIEHLPTAANISLSAEDFTLSPLQKAEKILDLENKDVSNRLLIKTEQLIHYLPLIARRVKDYSSVLKEEGINPEDIKGINLLREYNNLDNFFEDLALACVYNKKRLDDEDIVELVFSDNYKFTYFTYNGLVLTYGIGNKFFQNQEEQQEERNTVQTILNSFSGCTPTTFSIVVNCQRIYNDSQLMPDTELIPWLDFFEKYLYPAVSLSPEKIKELNDKNNRRNRRRNIFVKASRAMEETRDIEAAIKRSSSVNNSYYQVASIMASQIDCDSAGATLLNNSLQVWKMISSRTSMRSKIRQAIMMLRDEIIQDTATRALITQGIQIEENPRLFIREIEEEINKRIFCGLDVFGNIVETSFIDPDDMHPDRSQTTTVADLGLLKFELKVPKGFKGDTKSIYKSKSELYEEIIIKLILGFFISVLAGMMRDIVTALLGCDPNGDRDDALNDIMAGVRYGIIDINDYVGDVDIVKVAKESDIFNFTITNNGGEEVITKTDPTSRQLEALISDVSKMVTASEVDQLLFGTGSNLLYRLVEETITDGAITFPISSYVDPRSLAPGEQVPEVSIDPSVYDSFHMSASKIKTFFAALGDAMRDDGLEGIAMANISPAEAFCSSLDPGANIPNLSRIMDMDDLNSHYMDIAQGKIDKINAFCRFLKDIEAMQKDFERFVENLPLFDEYDAMLKRIADTTRKMWDALSLMWLDWFDEEPEKVSDARDSFYATKFGQELFYKIRPLISRYGPVSAPTTEIGSGGIFQAPAQPFQQKFPETSVGRFLSTVPLPYIPPEILNDKPWYYFGWGESKSTVETAETIFALRTAPNPLSKTLSIEVPGDNEEDYYDRQYNHLKRYWNYYNGSLPRDRWLPMNYLTEDQVKRPPRTLLDIGWYTDNGITIQRVMKKTHKQFVEQIENYQYDELGSDDGLEVIAQYIPVPSDIVSDDELRYSTVIPDKNSQTLNTIAQSSNLPSMKYKSMQKLVVYFSTGGGYNRDDFWDHMGGELKAPSELRAAVSVGNYTTFIDKTLDFSYHDQEGRSRMKTWLNGLLKPIMKVNDDVCVTNKEVLTASSIVAMIKSRIHPFLINVFPLGSVYPHWSTPVTKGLVKDYLYRKIHLDLSEKGLVNLIYDNEPAFRKVYVDESENELIDYSTPETPEDFLRYLVSVIYDKTLESATQIQYKNINTRLFRYQDNVWDTNNTETNTGIRYRKTLTEFFNTLVLILGKPGEGQPDLWPWPGLSDEQRDAAVKEIQEEILIYERDGDGVPVKPINVTPHGFRIGWTYLPIDAIIAQQLITYDSIINSVGSYSVSYKNSLSEIAAADDALLSAVTEEIVTKYSSDLIGFPASIVVNTSVNEPFLETFYSMSEAINRNEEIGIELGVDAINFPLYMKVLLYSITRTYGNAGDPFFDEDMNRWRDVGPIVLLRFMRGLVSGVLPPVTSFLPSVLLFPRFWRHGQTDVDYRPMAIETYNDFLLAQANEFGIEKPDGYPGTVQEFIWTEMTGIMLWFTQIPIIYSGGYDEKNKIEEIINSL